jgi:hypothetical protein
LADGIGITVEINLGDFSSSPKRQMEILAPPFPVAAHRDLSRFHQQETHQLVALLADMSQSLTIPLDSSPGTNPR